MNEASNNLFGGLLQRARESVGLSLTDAAIQLGIPKTTLWRWENGQTKIYAEKLVRVASAYGVSASKLFEGEVVIAPSQIDYERLGMVVEHVELIVQANGHRPKPEAVKTAVVEILRLETQRLLDVKGGEFDLSRYEQTIRGILGISN